jgi:hypothetical protein
MGYLVFKKYPLGEKKNNYAKAGMTSVIVCLLVAAFYRPIGETWGPAPSYLVNVLIGLLGSGVFGLLSTIMWLLTSIAWNVMKVVTTWIKDFAETLRKKGKKVSAAHKGAKVALLFFTVFIGFLIGASFIQGHAGTGISLMTYILGTGAGICASTVFILVEGMALEVSFSKQFKPFGKLGVIIFAAAIATITAYISFGWVYYSASEGTRFTEAKDQLEASMNGYLAATEGDCNTLANSLGNDPSAKMYTEPVVAMKSAIAQANAATSRKELEQAHRDFMVVGPKAGICLSREQRKLAEKGQGPLSKVILYNEPKPSDLSAQYWTGKVIPGVKVDSGAAGQAIVMVSILDYLLPLFMLFVLVISIFRNGDEPEEVEVKKEVKSDGKIVSVDNDDGGKVTTIHIDLGPATGTDVGDVLLVMSDEGDHLGAIRVVKSSGGNASECKLETRFVPVRGQLLALLPSDPEPKDIPPPPAGSATEPSEPVV